MSEGPDVLRIQIAQVGSAVVERVAPRSAGMSPEVLLKGRADRSDSESSSPTGTGSWRRLTVSLSKEYFRY